MSDQAKEIARLKEEVRALKAIILEMKEAIKLLTEKDERAKAFIERIEELASNLITGQQDLAEEIKNQEG